MLPSSVERRHCCRWQRRPGRLSHLQSGLYALASRIDEDRARMAFAARWVCMRPTYQFLFAHKA
eukprot:4029445-Prymnesium_polylepis.1